MIRPRDDSLVAERRIEPVSERQTEPVAQQLGETLADQRTGPVAEREFDGSIEFGGIDGPFDAWQRSVEVVGPAGDDDTVEVVERFDFEVAIPVWRFIFTPAVRGLVRKYRSGSDDDVDASSSWWTPPDRFDARAARSLSSTCSLAVIGGFLGGLIGQTLTFIAEDFGASTQDQTWVLAAVRIGAFGTALGMWMADRRGRKKVIVAAYVIAAIAAFAGALAPGLAVLAMCQIVCRGAVAAGVLLLPVTAAEELPAGSRAYGVALVTMAGALGVGGVTIASALMDAAPWAWRPLHAIALFAIPLTFMVARSFPESRRFEHLVEDTAASGGPASDAHHMQVRRLVVLGIGLVLLWFFVAPVAQLQNDFLNTERDYSAAAIAAFIIITNSLGGIGVVVAGRMADVRSRHLVASIGLLGIAVGNAVMFNATGAPMWIASTVGSILGAATIPTFGVFGPELFPTSRRGAANGLLNLTAVIGSVSGLLIAGAAIDRWGYGPTFAAMAITPLLVIVVLRWVPETARRELEDLNP